MVVVTVAVLTGISAGLTSCDFGLFKSGDPIVSPLFTSSLAARWRA